MSGPSSCGTPSSARFRVLVVDDVPVQPEVIEHLLEGGASI